MQETKELMNILLVDDDQWIREELHEFLTRIGYHVYEAGLPEAALRLVTEEEPDIVILDIKMPEMDGLEVLKRIKADYPEMEVIMITGHGDMQSVIQAMRLGASDYLTKPFQLAEIQAAIERTQKFIHMARKLKAAEMSRALLSQKLYDTIGAQIIGTSPAMRQVVDLMTRVAQADETTVLISGESGTGKELVARGIHCLSARKEQYFYSVNMSTIPETLFESECFGHKKGAFTGADKEKTGWFEVAHTSTLFLDEISTLDPELQAKLLRVLEEKTIVKVGSHHEIPVNVRVITATNTDLERLVHEKSFREDLYHRLNTFSIHLPPLRERKEDIPLLLMHFLSVYAQKMKKPVVMIDDAAIERLHHYEFPGNVRELKNMVERAVILCQGATLHERHFPIISSLAKPPEPALEESLNLEETEKRLIRKALQQAEFNKSLAAKLLGISWQSLDRRLKKLHLSEIG